MLKSEESQACRVELIYFTQNKMNERLCVILEILPLRPTCKHIEACIFFWYFLCEDTVHKLHL